MQSLWLLVTLLTTVGTAKVHGMAISYSDPNLVVSVDDDAFLRLWDTRTSKMYVSLAISFSVPRHFKTLLTSNTLNCVDVHPSGNLIVVGTAGGMQKISRSELRRRLT